MLEMFIKILQLFFEGRWVHKDMHLRELFVAPYDYRDLIVCVLILQGMYSVDVPDDLIMDDLITIEGFISTVDQLPKEHDDLFFARTIKIYADLLGHRSFPEDAITIH